MDVLPPLCKEVDKPRYQVERETQTDGLVNDDSGIDKIKGFSQVHTRIRWKGVSFVSVTVDEF